MLGYLWYGIRDLAYDESATIFAIAKPFVPVIKSIRLKNSFPVPIALYSIEIEDFRFNSTIKGGLSSGLVASPGSSWVRVFFYFFLIIYFYLSND